MIITHEQLADVRKRHADQQVVLTSGTFDLLHVGHLKYLEAVRSKGDIVIVILSSDQRVRERKSAQRPIIPEHDRALLLDALRLVDYVFISPPTTLPDQDDPIHAKIINDLQPDLYVTDGKDVRFAHLMSESGLTVLPRTAGGRHDSTSSIIDYIIQMQHQ